MDDITLLVLSHPAEPELALLSALPKNTAIVTGDSPEIFERAAPSADVILNWDMPLTLFRDVWRMAPHVRWIHSRAAGLDGVLFPGLIESSVPLTNGRGVFSESLGEFVIGAALHFAKDFRRLVRSQEAGIWDPFDVTDLSTQTMGIIGYGDIGRAVSRRARCMDMQVLALRRRPELSRDDPAVTEVLPLEAKLDLLSRSDYVVLSTPLLPETRGMIGKSELGAMKPTAVLINVGRGPLVDERALIEALEKRRIRGAALDVFEKEPLPPGHPLFRLDNVLLSPHSADHVPDWKEQAMRFFLHNFARFGRGEPLLNEVDKRRGY